MGARWWDLPVDVTRIWRVEGDGEVAGVVSGPCARERSGRWIVPGVATAGGAQARLHLANPFASDATVAISFMTDEGVLAPRLLENVVVPKRSVRVVELNQHAPERADLGVVVDTRAGRVVAEAVQSFNAAIGGVEGLSLVEAVPRAAETWTVPWFADTEARESWLWVSNPGDEAAAIELTVHAATGAAVPEGLEEITLEGGAIQRIDLRGLLPEGVSVGGLTVRSDNGVPIAVATATQVLDEDESRTGLAVVSAATDADSEWVLSGGATAGRDVMVQLVNASAEEAIVDLSLWAGTGSLRPDALQGLRVAPGAARLVDLTDELPDAPDHTVFVEAEEGQVVAGLVGASREGRLDLVVSLGIPMGPFAGGRTIPLARFEPGMVQRLETRLGAAFDDPGEELPGPLTTEPTGAP